MDYCVPICPKCGGTKWNSEIEPSEAELGTNDVRILCSICGYLESDSEKLVADR